MRRMRATPWIKVQDCGGKSEVIDLEFEKFDGEERNMEHHSPKYKKYIEFVKRFFHTDNPKELVYKGWHSKLIPVFCDRTDTIELVDSKTGEPVKMVAKELLKIARLLLDEQETRGV